MNAPRYELRPTSVAHPYRARFDRVTGERRPMIVEGVKLVDTSTGATLREGMRARFPLSELRELNGLAPLTAARVSAILRKAGHGIGKWNASARVRGWGEYSRGALVESDSYGRVSIRYVASHWSKHTHADEVAAVARYVDSLTAAGLTCLAFTRDPNVRAFF